MKGVTSDGVSAGSNQVGASEICEQVEGRLIEIEDFLLARAGFPSGPP